MSLYESVSPVSGCSQSILRGNTLGRGVLPAAPTYSYKCTATGRELDAPAAASAAASPSASTPVVPLQAARCKQLAATVSAPCLLPAPRRPVGPTARAAPLLYLCTIVLCRAYTQYCSS